MDPVRNPACRQAGADDGYPQVIRLSLLKKLIN